MLGGETLSFMQKLWDLAHALDVRSKQMARTLGVTGPQRLVIRILGQAPGISANEISSTLGMHPSTLTGILRRLERDHLLRRRPDETDGRRFRFELTTKGVEINGERRGTVEAAVRRALGRAEPTLASKTTEMIDLLVDELTRRD